MKEFDVKITAIIKKTYRVTAKDEDEAREIANQTFSVLPDRTPEKYDQQIDAVTEVKA